MALQMLPLLNSRFQYRFCTNIWIYVAQALLPVPEYALKEAGTDRSVCAT